MAKVTLQITARHFCAGLVVTNDVITGAAPILGYMKGWELERVVAYCRRKDWHIGAVAELVQAAVRKTADAGSNPAGTSN